MESFLIVILAILFSCQLIQALRNGSKSKNLPPGPRPLPIIGNLLVIGDQPHESLAEQAKLHGPIMFMKFGHVPTVVVSSAAAARELLLKHDLAFSTRHVPDSVNCHNWCRSSALWLPVDAQWKHLRKLYKTHIFSAERLHANKYMLSRKVQELVAFCRKRSQSGDSVDIHLAALSTTFNLISNILFSKDITDIYQDEAHDLKELIVNMSNEAGRPNFTDSFPVLKTIDPQGIRRRMSDHYDKIYQNLDGLISERLETKNPGQHNDVLDVCLKIREENPLFDRSKMSGMFLDLFAAGTDTSSNTIEWVMAELLRNPQTMHKAKQELDQVIGKGKLVNVAHVSSLPYLDCIIKETLRMYPSAPFLIPRKADTDVEFKGYSIPKDTQVIVNAWAIGRDPTLWEEPMEFKPERFLTSKLDVRGQDFELLPFGSGRRMCPGLPLALQMLSTIVGSLLNNFDWKLDGGIEPKELDMTAKFGISLEMAKHIRFVPIPLA